MHSYLLLLNLDWYVFQFSLFFTGMPNIYPVRMERHFRISTEGFCENELKVSDVEGKTVLTA